MMEFILTLAFLVGELASSTPEEKVEKIIVYQKETTVDLEGSSVTGELNLPPLYSISKTDSLIPESLVKRKLRFRLREHSKLNY